MYMICRRKSDHKLRRTLATGCQKTEFRQEKQIGQQCNLSAWFAEVVWPHTVWKFLCLIFLVCTNIAKLSSCIPRSQHESWISQNKSQKGDISQGGRYKKYGFELHESTSTIKSTFWDDRFPSSRFKEEELDVIPCDSALVLWHATQRIKVWNRSPGSLLQHVKIQLSFQQVQWNT